MAGAGVLAAAVATLGTLLLVGPLPAAHAPSASGPTAPDPAAPGPAAPGPGGLPGPDPAPEPGACRAAAVPERVALRPTSHAPAAGGWMELTMPPSPFGVTVTADGHAAYDVTVEAATLRRRPGRHYVTWAATPELDRVLRLGVLDAEGRTTGRVEWNKFLVFVTEEAGPEGERWEGPILLTGLSPSGLLHTMRGHGIFEAHGVGC